MIYRYVYHESLSIRCTVKETKTRREKDLFIYNTLDKCKRKFIISDLMASTFSIIASVLFIRLLHCKIV